MKIVLVHDWLYTYVGSEKVVESILRCLPVEKIYTLVDFLPEAKRSFLNNVPVQYSFLQYFPLVRSLRRYYLPLMPLAIESFDVSSADLVITSSSAIAKGILTNADQLHVCYCHTPARYFWDLTNDYLRSANLDKGLRGALARIMLQYMRLWDVVSANRVDYFVANSKYIAKRIWNTYRRESTVIYPPVNVETFQMKSQKDNYYLTMSRLESYKRVDLIVAAFAHLKKKLVVVGQGPELEKLKAQATSNVEILGFQPDDVVIDLMQRARAFIFAAKEDFGIVSVEAQACGTPVIAFGQGGSLETVRGVFPGVKVDRDKTGIFFPEQTVQALIDAINWFEKNHTRIEPAVCRQQAEHFSREIFERKFHELVKTRWNDFKEKGKSGIDPGPSSSSAKFPGLPIT
jgi:glycosyltransferase involved in cell wall biosynthesis